VLPLASKEQSGSEEGCGTRKDDSQDVHKIPLDVLDKARSAIRDQGKARTKSGFGEKKEGDHSWWWR
jgi:hypothetical protein